MDYFRDCEYHQMVREKERRDDRDFEATMKEETEEEFQARIERAKQRHNTTGTQAVIDAASKLYDEQGYTRSDILAYLNGLRDSGIWMATDDTIRRVFDLVVG